MRLVHRFRIARLYRTPVPVLVIVPTHLSVAGERGVSAGSPGQGTVVAITPGVGTEEGACPLPAGGGTANPPPCPRHDNLPERTGRALIACSLIGIKTVFRGGGRLLTAE